jgi:CubicO group peptidase (beta-lactamase class C family)
MNCCTSRVFVLGFLAFASSLSVPALAQLPAPVYPGAEAWAQMTPAELGLDASKLAEARAYAESKQGAGLVVRNGYKVLNWGSQTSRFPVASVTKGVGALLLGLAVSDGALNIEDRAQLHFPDIGMPENVDNQRWLSLVTLEQLATHSSGFKEPQGAPSMGSEPGTAWTYSNGGANWLADTLTFKWSEDLQAVLTRRVLEDLGIAIGRDLTWRENLSREPFLNGIVRREFNAGISMDVDAMARIGLLVARGGEWNGVRIVSEQYVSQMLKTSTTIEGLPIVDGNGVPDDDYPNVTAHHGLFWFNNADGALPGVPRDAAWTWGAGDHLIVVIPSLDIVVARTSGDGSQPAPWGQCSRGIWCTRYEILSAFLTPIAQAAQPAAPAAPSVSLRSNVASVTVGGAATLTWESTLADSCSASSGWTGAKATSGTETVTISQSATYTLSCTGAGGTTESSVSITASPAQNPNPPPSPPGGGRRGGGALQWWALGALLLIGAYRPLRRRGVNVRLAQRV